ncbi:ATP-binding cassette domain-containing protein [Luteibacter sp. 3190]|uniref:ABC transporter ATP-binding protein n=1 Tax=Luteibacter sp. 3190 TaxID=2817736 RepID=UPI00286601A2|nr:ATP-binding cassette domain-containing protein [Luteibacter sp. 3190]MDR6937950.1 ABC-2 type transport system ATP-binding protein [Luteibacter sp. 3190]
MKGSCLTSLTSRFHTHQHGFRRFVKTAVVGSGGHSAQSRDDTDAHRSSARRPVDTMGAGFCKKRGDGRRTGMIGDGLLNVEGVSRRRAGRAAVADVSFRLNGGEVLGLLGVNGAGKSTTLSMLAGALRPDRGRILLAGKDFVAHPGLARTLVGWLPESAPLWPELSVDEHLLAFARLRGATRAAARRAADAMVARLQLEPLRRRMAGVLSQGQRQRLGLACALVHDPALIILDEPANALDPVQVGELRKLIRERAAAGAAVILSTHVLGEVVAVCDRVAILHEGSLRHDAPLQGDEGGKALEATFFGIATGNAA